MSDKPACKEYDRLRQEAIAANSSGDTVTYGNIVLALRDHEKFCEICNQQAAYNQRQKIKVEKAIEKGEKDDYSDV